MPADDNDWRLQRQLLAIGSALVLSILLGGCSRGLPAPTRVAAEKTKSLTGLSQSGRFWKVPFDDLRFPEQVCVAIWELEGDVNNGGFDQYYFNSSGDTAFFVVGALEKVGAAKTASIVRDANSMFPAGVPPRDRRDRQALLEKLRDAHGARLDRLDKEFYSRPDDLAALLSAYIQVNAAEIEGAASRGE